MIQYCFALFIYLASMLPAHSYILNSNASHGIAMDYASKTILFERLADEKMHPSSMSKLMTLYVAFSKLKSGIVKMNDRYTVSKVAWKIGGSSMFLKIGQIATVEDLLRGIIIVSGNDAAISLAEGIAGSEENFVKEMNIAATRLGLSNSNFVNTTGLTDRAHMMSSRDLLKLAVTMYEEFPEYYHLFQERELTYNNVYQPNTNELLLSEFEIDGMKTGFTDSGGFGVVLAAEKDQRRVFAVINGLQRKSLRSEDGRRLLQYAFSNFDNKILFKAGDIIDNVSVWFGQNRTVPLVVPEDVIITYERGDEKSIQATVTFEDIVEAPIDKNQRLGVLEISVPNKEIRTIPLYAAYAVSELSFAKKILRKIGRMIGI